MKKATLERHRHLVNKLSSIEVPLEPQEARFEALVAPHEWAELLDSFDDDPQTGAGPFNLENEALWERLTSTQWLAAAPTSKRQNG